MLRALGGLQMALVIVRSMVITLGVEEDEYTYRCEVLGWAQLSLHSPNAKA